eukprot:maker-scaffold_8-snap-gene-2.18-mRNA-1 protein AED:0.01 eAED:0.01 QI:22/1/1/1/1/1/3/114/621
MINEEFLGFLQQGELNSALDLCSSLIKKNDQSRDFYIKCKLRVLISLENFDEAQRFLASTDSNSKNANLLALEKAYILYRQKKFSKAWKILHELKKTQSTASSMLCCILMSQICYSLAKLKAAKSFLLPQVGNSTEEFKELLYTNYLAVISNSFLEKKIDFSFGGKEFKASAFKAEYKGLKFDKQGHTSFEYMFNRMILDSLLEKTDPEFNAKIEEGAEELDEAEDTRENSDLFLLQDNFSQSLEEDYSSLQESKTPAVQLVRANNKAISLERKGEPQQALQTLLPYRKVFAGFLRGKYGDNMESDRKQIFRALRNLPVVFQVVILINYIFLLYKNNREEEFLYMARKICLKFTHSFFFKSVRGVLLKLQAQKLFEQKQYNRVLKLGLEVFRGTADEMVVTIFTYGLQAGYFSSVPLVDKLYTTIAKKTVCSSFLRLIMVEFYIQNGLTEKADEIPMTGHDKDYRQAYFKTLLLKDETDEIVVKNLEESGSLQLNFEAYNVDDSLESLLNKASTSDNTTVQKGTNNKKSLKRKKKYLEKLQQKGVTVKEDFKADSERWIPSHLRKAKKRRGKGPLVTRGQGLVDEHTEAKLDVLKKQSQPQIPQNSTANSQVSKAKGRRKK